MREAFPKLTLLLLLCGLVGCSGPTTRTLIDSSDENKQEGISIDWAEYEDFSLDAYQEEVKNFSTWSIHDVPDILLAPSMDSLTSRVEQNGFRIQLLATLDKLEADQAVEDALVWWEEFEMSSSYREVYAQNESEPPVYLDFRAPYYRVRIGNFPNQAFSCRDQGRLCKCVRSSGSDIY